MMIAPMQGFAYEEDLNGLLSGYVKPVKKDNINYHGVDYDSWSQDKRHVKVRNAIQKQKINNFKSKDEALSFWINAYNFFVVDLIIQKGERDSIQDLKGVESPFKRYKWSVDGKVYTLQEIMDQHIRSADDERVHFALSCAAKSCPDLYMQAYSAKKLDNQLSLQTKKFIQNKAKGFNITKKPNTVIISPIFKEYSDDFNKGNVKSWLQPHFPLFINAVTKITYFDFDWSLNSQEGAD